MGAAWVLAAAWLGTAGAQDIVGGETTDDFPEVGALAIPLAHDMRSFCSGTLVRSTWVLTAAHCLTAAQELLDDGTPVYFVVGRSVRGDGIDDYARVELVLPHPDYEHARADIGLVQLEGRGLPDWPTMPINLDPVEDEWMGTEVVHVGFGATGDDGRGGGTKRVTEIPAHDTWRDMLVTYDPYGETATCNGDSGGAALRADDETGALELVGVNAVGFSLDWSEPTCEGPLSANGATRTDEHLDWILDHIGPEEEPEPEAPPVDDIETIDEPDATPSAPLKTSTPDQPEPPGACSSVGMGSMMWAWLAGLAVVGRRRS